MNKNLYNLSAKMLYPLTTVYVKKDNKVLLLKRKLNKQINPGRLSGLGGKIEPKETLFDSAKREVQEESGLIITNPKLKGTMYKVTEESVAAMYIFLAEEFEGQLRSESDEGSLAWYAIDQLDNIDTIVDHQKLYMQKILQKNNSFFSGMTIYKNGKIVEYLDNTKYFEQRENKVN